MKKFPLLSSFLVLGIFSINAQVGVNTNVAPLANLEVKSSTNPNQADGVMVTKVTVAELNTKAGVYTAPQEGAMVYVTNITWASIAGKTDEIKVVGFHYFNGAKWMPVTTKVEAWAPVAEIINTSNSTWWTSVDPSSNYFNIEGGATTTLQVPPPTAFVGKLITLRNKVGGNIGLGVSLAGSGFLGFTGMISGNAIQAYSDGTNWFIVAGRHQ